MDQLRTGSQRSRRFLQMNPLAVKGLVPSDSRVQGAEGLVIKIWGSKFQGSAQEFAIQDQGVG